MCVFGEYTASDDITAAIYNHDLKWFLEDWFLVLTKYNL